MRSFISTFKYKSTTDFDSLNLDMRAPASGGVVFKPFVSSFGIKKKKPDAPKPFQSISKFGKIEIYQKGFVLDETKYSEKKEPAKYNLYNTNNSLFITGKAGTGKSTLLKEFVKYCESKDINCVVVAPTGIAAINVNGSTIHSMFQIDIHNPTHLKKLNPAKRAILKAIDVLIIDEISMVSDEIFELIEKRMNQAKFGDNPHSKRFGGIRVLIFGDVFQLGPVNKEGETQVGYFFESQIFQQLYQQGNIKMLELTKIWRQDDKKFIDVLNNIRSGSVDDKDLLLLNNKIINDNPQDFAKKNNFSILCSTNNQANIYNNQILNQNANQRHIFSGKLVGEFTYYDSLPPQEMELKKECLVVLVKNDVSKRYVNGDFGIIKNFVYRLTISNGKEISYRNFYDYHFQKTEIKEEMVKLEKTKSKLEGAGYFLEIELTRTGETVLVGKESWEKKSYEMTEEKVTMDGEDMIQQKLKDKTIGAYTQFPVKVGYALTVHKSQGMTLEGAILDFGRGTFGSGLVYVALSRVKSLENLYLTSAINASHIKLDPKVIDFHGQVVEGGLV
jgi:ATP-dependent exoDNAse (exonuclease V) alpha subunit